MENLRLVTNEVLVTKLRTLIQEEREISLKILELINEVERRRLHLELGFSSLFDWLTRELGYSAAAAMRRIDSARLLRKVPTIATQIESGSSISQTWREFNPPFEPKKSALENKSNQKSS